MALYVWAQYYYGPPVNKTIKSYEIEFARSMSTDWNPQRSKRTK